MEQMFNPGIAVVPTNTRSPFQAPIVEHPGPNGQKMRRRRRAQRAKQVEASHPKRTIEGFEIRTGIPIPEIKKKKQMGKWERLYNAMKVGECVVMDKVQSNRFQVWAHSQGKAVSIRTVDGEVLVFKRRNKTTKIKEVTQNA